MSEIPFWSVPKSSDFFTDYGPYDSFYEVGEQYTGGQSVDVSSVRFRSKKLDDIINSERINYKSSDTPSEIITSGSCIASDVEFTGLGQYQAKIRKRKVEAAKSVCSMCTVSDICLEFGETTVTVDTDRYLIFGGKTAKEIIEQRCE